jgi:uncharacterized phiE125 gp8 family phage protein
MKIITPPVSEPITLAEAKTFLRVDHTDEDILIQSLITASREYCEVFQRRSIATKTYEMTLDRFPSERFIRIPLPPLKTVSSVIYKDSEGTDTTFTDYVVDTDNEPGQIVLDYNKSWPSFTPYPVNVVRIQFTAGYDEIPEQTKQAMYMLIGHWYENRESVSPQSMNTVPFATDALLYPNRVW